MVKIIQWEACGGADGNLCYRLDKPGEGERFFKDLLKNAEFGDEELDDEVADEVTLAQVSEQEWIQMENNEITNEKT